jgi:hypothetical protein
LRVPEPPQVAAALLSDRADLLVCVLVPLATQLASPLFELVDQVGLVVFAADLLDLTCEHGAGNALLSEQKAK